VLGAPTPLAAAVVIATMITAIERVHFAKGPWVSDGGYEYNVVLLAAVLSLADTGPGSPSVDSARGSEHARSEVGSAGAPQAAGSQALPASTW
jgi:putative oxidoreductase